MRVFLLRMVAAKNSRNRRAACSPASAMIAGTTTGAANGVETLAGTASSVTAKAWAGWWVGSGSRSDIHISVT
jgi:hypothetical protein